MAVNEGHMEHETSGSLVPHPEDNDTSGWWANRKEPRQKLPPVSISKFFSACNEDHPQYVQAKHAIPLHESVSKAEKVAISIYCLRMRMIFNFPQP